jgi:hypothetical protein
MLATGADEADPSSGEAGFWQDKVTSSAGSTAAKQSVAIFFTVMF